MALTMDPDLTLEHLRHLQRAVIDSSSIIYASKAGVLDTLCSTVELTTVRDAVDEVGYDLPLIQIRTDSAGNTPVDDQILACAGRERLAVISEDRQILLSADDLGLRCYNMLIVLELMLLRDRITLREWDEARKRLLAAAQYSSRVVHAGNMLHWAVRKETG